MKHYYTIYKRHFLSVCVLIALSSFFVPKVVAQEAQFSQFNVARLYLNPAMAGSTGAINFNTNYRLQWRAMGEPFRTNQISAIMPLQSNKNKGLHWGGAGVSFYNDWAGEGSLRTLGINGTLAYNINLTADEMHKISLGLQGGLVQKSINFSTGWGSQYNPSMGADENIQVYEGQLNSSNIFADVATGLAWHYNVDRAQDPDKVSAHVGVSAYHVTKPDESLVDGQTIKLPRVYKAHARVEARLMGNARIAPSILAICQQGKYLLNGGALLTYEFMSQSGGLGPSELQFGSWYRYNDAFIFATGVSHQKYAILFSYDLNHTTARKDYVTGKGAYELSLIVRMAAPKKAAKRTGGARFISD